MKFKAGDRVRIIKATALPCLVGEVGVISEALGYLPRRPSCRPEKFAAAGIWYRVSGPQYPAPFRGIHLEENLELIPPDKQATVPWSECYFVPRDLHVQV